MRETCVPRSPMPAGAAPALTLAAAMAMALAPLAAPAAPQGIALAVGAGTRHTQARLSRLSLTTHWRTHLAERRAWRLGGYWEMDVGGWRVTRDGVDHRSVVGIGFAPVLRLRGRRPWREAGHPYVDAGLGVEWLSSSRSGGTDLSTRYQFSPRLGVGLVFERGRRVWELGYQYFHLSNANTRFPNPGLNFHMLRVGMRF